MPRGSARCCRRPRSRRSTSEPRRERQAKSGLENGRPVGQDQRSSVEDVMPFYLTRFSYTPETWARLIEKPEDRRAAAQQYIESVGGRLHGFWYAFGEYDAYNLWEAPENVSM